MSRALHRVEVQPGLVALRDDDANLFLEATPLPAEGLLSFTRRLTGGTEAAGGIRALNANPTRLLAGVRYRVPFDLLDDAHQVQVIRALFPQDRGSARGWTHAVTRESLTDGATLWRLAVWFTGDGKNFRALREVNGLVDDGLSPGQTLLVPAVLLRPGLRAMLPSPAPSDSALEFRGEGTDAHAVYRLRPGEALYSSVVVRFTGRIYADDVNALASEIASASAIRDVTDIPIGYEVKLPLDLLLPEYLPLGHPRKVEYEASLTESQRFSNEVQSHHLEGITVVLDAGHGGADVGASKDGVWESLHVYDIMVRAREILETRTAATVVATVRDGNDHRIEGRDVLPFSRGHQVLTDPPYPIQDAKIGVNLRWYLANSVLRRTIKAGSEAKKVVFVSIHADSLHPSLRGAMVYIPSTQLTAGSFGRSGAAYSARAEYREKPRVEYSWRERSQSEGLSRDLAGRVLGALHSRGLAIHEFKPIREKIIRKNSEYVPAVLRYNGIPAKILLEVSNLANTEDRRLIQTQAFRQKMAEALVQGILAYYGEDLPLGEPVQVAKAK
ncbi:MAG: N-acetylmuramoyl-L-alanine amidase [Thermoanaerobaculia bacterium]|nr:N-acetylmuramoyl-L-alanine amidase [Thermoanaerobaculia bacterium]